MTDWTSHGMSDDPQILLKRLAAYVRPIPAKRLSRLIGCDVRTAENMRSARSWPVPRHWVGLIATFGEDITDAIFHPLKTKARLERELKDLEAAAERKRGALRDVQGLCAGLAEAEAEPQGLKRRASDRSGAER